ncbi:MAG TPA: hypothetical protein VGK96_21840, partial [Candidatus Sulfotelmatobacter sp.]
RFRYSDLKEAALSGASGLWALNVGEVASGGLGDLDPRVERVFEPRVGGSGCSSRCCLSVRAGAA